jgi:hypothetical protein
VPSGTRPGDELRRLQAQHWPISSWSSWRVDVLCTADPGCTREAIPFSAIARASSEACACAKPAG